MSLPKPYYQDDWATIYHGDCREILPLLPKVDLVLTDPPYGHNNNNGDMISRRETIFGGEKVERERRPISNDGEEANELVRWFFCEAKKLLVVGGCCCCCCGGGGPDPQFARWSLWMEEAIGFKHAVVWDKGPMGMGHHYRRSYEFILVGQNGNPCKWYAETKDIENIIRPGDLEVNKIIPSAEQHPTEKPIGLMKWFIPLHSRIGETILDPFMGSGTTLRAAKDLKRKSIGIEIEEKYCEIAVKRLRQEVLI
jgi:site-specific DNA-methyltransferase (adenine-specific)